MLRIALFPLQKEYFLFDWRTSQEVILITQSMDDVPFDLKHLRCIVYEYTPRGTQTLEQNLKNTVVNILARPG